MLSKVIKFVTNKQFYMPIKLYRFCFIFKLFLIVIQPNKYYNMLFTITESWFLLIFSSLTVIKIHKYKNLVKLDCISFNNIYISIMMLSFEILMIIL